MQKTTFRPIKPRTRTRMMGRGKMACDLKHATSSVKHGGDNVAQILFRQKKNKKKIKKSNYEEIFTASFEKSKY